jgi:transposase
MDVFHEVCCGLDVHKKSVTACVRWTAGRRQQTRKFGTFTKELLELCDWLHACGVTHVALESTGVYWKPVWNLLEGQFEVLLVNAQHVKAVPGGRPIRKTANGSLTCCNTIYCAPVLCHPLRFANCVI